MTDTPLKNLFPYGGNGKKSPPSPTDTIPDNLFDVLYRRIDGPQQLAKLRSAAGADVAIESLGSIVRNYRKAAGLSQKEVATRAGVGRRFILEFESGKRTVALEQVLAVGDAMGLHFSISERRKSPLN